MKGDGAREGDSRFRLLVESIRDYAIFMLDPEGRVQTWNAGAERIKGYRADEIIGRHFSTFYPPEAGDFPSYELKVAAAEGRFEDEGWRVPALALTAFARPDDRKHAILAGYQAHLAKPYDVAELVVVVAGLAGRT